MTLTACFTGGGMTTLSFDVARTAEQRREPWEAMEREGLTRAVLWNTTRPTLYDWLTLVDPAHTFLGLVHADGSLAGAFWVLPMGLSGTVHFAMFRCWRHEQVFIGVESVRFIFYTWPLESLLATFPAPYRHLYPFITALGFKLWPERLPRACHMPTEKNPHRCVDMRFASLCRSFFEVHYMQKKEA